jgi:zinc protease
MKDALMHAPLLAPRSRAAMVTLVPFGDPAEGRAAWLVEDHAVPVVALVASIDGGAAQDAPGKAGAAALMANLLDEGAGSLDDEAFHRALDEQAIEFSAHADRDAFRVQLRTLARNLDRAGELAALALNAPRFDQAPLDRVRAQMTAGLRRQANDPDARAAKAWREAAYPGHPYARSAEGALDTLPAIARDDLVALRRACFARQGLHVAIVGAISAERARALLDRLFGQWPATGARAPVPDVAAQGAGRRIIVDIDLPQTTLRFGAPGLDRHDPDFDAGVFVNHILGGGVFSARLFREVREARGLAYSVWSQLANADHSATLAGATTTKNERAAESLSVIEAEIARMAQDGPTEDELAKAKSYLVGSYDLRFDSSTKIAGALVSIQRDGFSPAYLDERNARIEAVTLADARRVARRLFDQKLLWAMAGRPLDIAPV